MRRNRQKHTGAVVARPVANEHGFVMVMALMMLVVLSLMGTAAMTVRNTEQAIVRNAEVVQNNFFAVEAVTLEGATVLENTADSVLKDIETVPLSWLKPNDPDPVSPNHIDLAVSNSWPSALITPADTMFKASTPKIGARVIAPTGYAPDNTSNGDRMWYAAVQGNLNSDSTSYQICRGSNLSDPDKEERCYSVHGMYDVKSGAGKAYTGRRMMMVGYKKTVYLN